MNEITPHKVEAGERIFAAGDTGDCAYLIKTGAVRVSVGEGEQQRTLGLLGEGQLLGEMAVIDNSPRMADAYAHEDTVLQRIESHQFLDRVEQADPLLKKLLHVVVKRYRGGLERVRMTAAARAPAALTVDDYYPLRVEAALKKDLDAGRVAVQIQPVLNLGNEQTVGFEALLRWHSEAFPEMGTQALVGLAEQTRLINDLGYYVFERACAEFVAAGLHQRHWLSINVSAKQLLESDFVERCEELAREQGMPFSQLVFELTESCIPEAELIQQPLSQLREKGARVALDDYGNGSSSLIHVCKFKVDFVKLDSEIISGLETLEEARVVVKAVVGAAKALDIRVVAEGVQTAAQRDFLADVGCELVQGYWYAEPAEAAEFGSA
jgi:EAL domain-containing protein (putative c-di-GMP-specific phosphodiesterase class I)